MAENTGITPVMPIGEGMAGGSSFVWIFGLIVLLALFNGGGLFGGGNAAAAALGYENLATSAEIQNGFNAQNSMAQSRDILSAVTGGTPQTNAASTAHESNANNEIKHRNAA